MATETKPVEYLKGIVDNDLEVINLFYLNPDEKTVTVHQEEFYSMGEPDPDEVITLEEARERYIKMLSDSSRYWVPTH